MSITQPGAAPPLREFRQFDRFQDQLRAMREESEELRNQAIFKIDDDEEEKEEKKDKEETKEANR